MSGGIKAGLIAFGCVAAIGVPISGWAMDPPDPEPNRSPTHREQLRTEPVEPDPFGNAQPAEYPREFRSIDGHGNNALHVDWGRAGTTLLRLMTPAYGDGIGHVPAGQDRPSTRLVSNIVMAQPGDMPNDSMASDFLWQWGQFLDHDIVETPVAAPREAFDIPVPVGDPWFDPDHEGGKRIPLDRSGYLMVDNVRQQVNHITSYIDGSMVYGSDKARAKELRTMDGTGRMKVSEGNLLPFNVNGFDNAPNSHDASFFLAGDIRCNEQNGLTAMHTLFVREHNYWAARIREQRPNLSGEMVYQYAKAIVTAEIQAITYNEFLPALLGPTAIPTYRGYDPRVNATVSNFFATSAFRMGHSLLSPRLLRLDANGEMIEAGHLSLVDAFFKPDQIVEHGIEPLLRGLSMQRAQTPDPYTIDAIRNFLFGPPGAGGFDLASLNVQRGRDHGLPSYNAARIELGLDPVESFAEISSNPDIQANLEEAYGEVDLVDAWVGMLAEPPMPDSMIGQCLSITIQQEFIRLRDGDRFWYESYLSPYAVEFVNRQSLAKVIRRNTDIGSELADDVFHVPQ